MRYFFLITMLTLGLSSYSIQQNQTIDSLIYILTEERHDSIKTDIFIQLSERYLKSDVKMAISYGNKAKSLAEENKFHSKKAHIYSVLGRCYYHLGEYESSLNYYKKALDVSKKEGNKLTIGKTLNNMAMVYTNSNNLDKGVKKFKEALEIFEELSNNDKAGAVCINISSVYTKKQDYDKALFYLSESSRHFSKVDSDLWMRAKVLGARSMIYSLMGNHSQALEDADEALSVGNKTGNMVLLGEMHLTVSEVQFNSGNYLRSIVHADSLIYFAKQSNAKLQLQNGYRLLNASYEKLNKTDEAYDNYKLFISYRDSILIEDQKKHITDTEIKFELLTKQQQIELLESDNEVLRQGEVINKQKKQNLIVGIVFIVLLTIIGYFMYSMRLKKAKIEKSLLKEKLDITNKELTNYALHIIQKNNMLNAMKDDLKSLKRNNSEEERSNIAQDLIMKLKNELGLEKDRVVFNKQLKLVGDEFLMKLNKQFPKLTSNEKQMATLLRLKLTSKEIASILNISHNSVNVNRYRLRKKLALKKEMDLVLFLNSI